MIARGQVVEQQTVLSNVELILAADIWSVEPKIMSANLGFEGIIGVETVKDAVVAAGGAWNSDLSTCSDGSEVPLRSLTSAADPANVYSLYDCADRSAVDHLDAVPVCFSWPVVPSSIKREHFKFTRTDGKVITPNCLSSYPNYEFNERHCVVLFDEFANRIIPAYDEAGVQLENGHIGIKSVEIVGPLMLAGPEGQVVDAGMLGLRKDVPIDSTPYFEGPELLSARLIPATTDGEMATPSLDFGSFPNSGEDLYRTNDAQNLYRLRIYIDGGMTPNGVNGVLPTQFDDYFTINLSDGTVIDQANVPAHIEGGTVTVLGLADLGRKSTNQEYDPICYIEDRDNYFDVMLEVNGEAPDLAISQVVSVLAFSKGKQLYTPGGPGTTPTPGTTYTAPSPPDQIVEVNVDLERRFEANYCESSTRRGIEISTDKETCMQWLERDQLTTLNFGSVVVSDLTSSP